MAVFGGSALKIEQDSRHSFEKQQAALIKTAEPTSESSKKIEVSSSKEITPSTTVFERRPYCPNCEKR